METNNNVFKSAIFICSLGLLATFSYGQQADYWYFGMNAGLHFTDSTSVEVLFDGSINTREGCSSISSNIGELILYTDGRYVYDKFHGQMPNGFDLSGSLTTTQSALVVPDPRAENQFYIFTTHTDESSVNLGLNYNIVDMSLNGGLGDVTLKNQFLLLNRTEKLCGVHHENNSDVWIATYNRNDFALYSYLVSNTGIEAPVVTPTIHFGNARVGQMKFSSQGNRLASVFIDTLGIFDFNNSTGEFSNPVYIPLNGFDTITGSRVGYGVEFSPNGHLLYVTHQSQTTPNDDILLQLDLTDYNSSSIVANANIIPTNFSNGDRNLASLQLGPNGKLYVSITTQTGSNLGDFLGEVRFPNHPGINCTFITDGLSLSPKNSRWGLPNFVQSIFNNVPDLQFSVNINELDATEYQCYPNPVYGELNLEGLPIHSTIQLLDMTGRTISTLAANGTTATINTSGLVKGSYLVRVVSDKGMMVKKVMVR